MTKKTKKLSADVIATNPKFLQTLFKNLPGMVYHCRNDRHWTMLFLSDYCKTLTGYTPYELINNRKTSYADLIHPDDRKQVWEGVQKKVRKGHPFKIEYRICTKSGKEKWVWEQGRAVPGKKKWDLEGFITDITEEKMARSELKESERRFQTFFESIPDSIFIADLVTRQLVDCNQSALKLTGYTKKEVLAMKADQLHPKELVKKTMEDFKKHAAGKLMVVESEVLRKDGKRVPVSINTSVITIEGKPHLQGVFRDISEHKKAENELLKEKDWSNMIIRYTPNIVIGLGKKSKILIFNHFAESLTGYKASEVIGKKWIDIFIPKGSRKQLYSVWDYIMKNKKINHRYTNIILTKKGEEKLIQWNNNFIKENRHFKMVLSIGEDITESHKAEEKFIEKKERFQALFESSRDAIMTLEPPTWAFTSGNPATVKMFACKNEKDFLTYPPWKLSPPTQPDGQPSGDKAKAMIMKAMEEGSNFFDWVHRRKNGEDFPAMVSLNRLSVGGKVFLQATVRDITEQKKDEKELKEKVQQMELMARANLKRHKETMRLRKENKLLKNKIDQLNQ